MAPLRFSIPTLAFLLLGSLCAASVVRTALPTIEDARQRIAADGCNPNVCYALDGSASINDTEWEYQQNFVKMVTNLIGFDPAARFSGMQYGLESRLISLPTTSGDFQEKVHFAKSMKARRTYIAPGIAACRRILRRTKGEPNKIVLLGDGRSNFDSDLPPFDPESVAQAFLDEGVNADGTNNHSISAVAVHFSDTIFMQNIIGDTGTVFQVEEWDEVIDIAAALTMLVCGYINFF